MLLKSTLRTIGKSLGRYIAILAIIALGVGFFSGLKVSEPAMIRTADGYIRELKLHDFRLISTLGFTDEDVAAISALDGVELARGSVGVELEYETDSGSAAALKAHMLLDGVNGVDLKYGRLPAAGNECLADSMLMGEDSLGTVIRLTDRTPESSRDALAYDEYVVVGICDSSEYMSFERGSTSLASGMLAGFLYLPPEGFESEYFTEIYVKLPDSGEIFSDEYESALDAIRPRLESLVEERAELRYETLLSDAEDEISKAEREISDAKSELADAEAELAEGRETLERERADADKKLADAERELSDARKQLDDGYAELEENRNKIANDVPELRDELDRTEATLDSAEQDWRRGLDEYESGKVEAEAGFKAAEAELAAAREQLDSGRAELDALKSAKASDIPEIAAQIASGEAELAALKSSPASALPEVQAQIAAAEAQLAWMKSAKASEIPEISAQISTGEAELAAGEAQYEAGVAELASRRAEVTSELESAKAQLDDAKAQLDSGRAELETTRFSPATDIAEFREKLDEAASELADAEREYADGLAELAKARADADREFADAEAELADGEAKIADAKVELADGEAKLADAREELAKLDSPTTYVLDRSSNIGCASLENDTAIISGVAKVFPLFFFLVAALVCITTITRMVSEQRTQNGVLKALGYSSGAIAGQYLFYSGSASAIGCVVGFFLASSTLPAVFWFVYGIMYSVDRPLTPVYDWGLFAGISGLYLLCSLGVTYAVCRRDLKESAAQLIRPKAPSAGKRILLERVGFVWNRLKFLHKVSIRNILRYKKRMLMMIIGIGGCTALLLTGFGIRDTIKPIVDRQYGEIELYDASVRFTGELDEAELEAFRAETAGVTESLVFLHLASADVKLDGSMNEINLVSYDDAPSEFVSLHDGSTELAYPGKGEVVVNNRFADAYGVKVGDVLTLSTDDIAPTELVVSGIYDNYLYDYAFVRRESFADAPGFSGAYVNFNGSMNDSESGAVLLGAENTASLSLSSEMRSRIGNMLSSLDYIVIVVLVCAGALAFIVLYNLTNITITERTREIATLKVLGFFEKEQDAYVFRENLVLTGISALCGIPLGLALLSYVMAQIKVATFYFGCVVAPMSYIWAILVTFIFTVLVDLAMTFKTRRINMAEAMKAIE